ncbi:hypothetical protein [Cohnella sp. REN36]|uniref:hypothetical protein n=1 Tax=Cohnella sp. REN36 TaxID=2887347 RepID=UPI001D155828|nr:hypothetical protein [Cohnella sp. REN36]MCC3375037.1 hypothetical protein [Cohnella sp. REN36]
MKKYLLAGWFGAAAIAVLAFWHTEKDRGILAIQPQDAVSVEMYQGSGTAAPGSEAQAMMTIDEPPAIAEVLSRLDRIRPNDRGKPMDGDYTLNIHLADGSSLLYVYEKGYVTTSDGFRGRVESDNVLNRLWADLPYPVRDPA